MFIEIGAVLAEGKGAAYEAGRMMGGIIFLPLLLWGIIHCFKIMQREETSALCVLGLALVLMGFFLSAATGIVLRNVTVSPGVRMGISGALGILFFLLAFGGLVVAIVGLSLYRRGATPYNQGRGQAVWALILSLAPIVALIFSIFSAQKDRNAFVDVGASLPDSGPIFENESLNIKFKKPGGAWIEMDPKIHNPFATLLLRSPRKGELFMLIGERIGTELGFTRESLADIAKTNLKAVQGDFTFSENTERTINGIDYLTFSTKIANVNGLSVDMYYEHWVASKNGYCYQLISNTQLGNEKSIAKLAEEMAERFELIDPDAVVRSATPPVEKFESKESRFSVDLSGLGWNEWGSLEVDYPEAEFAALKKGILGTGITTLELGGDQFDIDAIATGFVAAVFEQFHPADTQNRKTITQGVAEGISFESNVKTDEGNFDYRFRILKKGSRAWCVAGWTLEGDESGISDIEEALDAYLPIDVADDAVSEEKPLDRIVTSRALILNQIGLEYYRRQSYEIAQGFFQRAFEGASDDGQIFENWIDSHKQTGQNEEGLKLLDAHGEEFKDNLTLHAYRGWFHGEEGETQEALDAYKIAFDGGYDDEDDLLDYVNLFVDQDDRDAGIEALKQFRKKNPRASSDVERWHASLLAQKDETKEAIKMLKKLLEESPSSLTVLSDLITTQLDAEHYTDALVDIDQAIDVKGLKNSYYYFLRGRAKLGLNSLREAKTAFEEAQKLDPNDLDVQDYLDYTSAMLGKSNVASIKSEIEPVPFPSEVAKKAAALVDNYFDDLSKEEGYVSKSRIYGIQFKKGEPQKITRRTTLKITNSAGIDNTSTLRFPFDPLTESIYINEVIVKNADGETVAEGNVDDYYLVDKNTDVLATTDKVVHVPVPGLEIGHTLTYVFTREDHALSDSFSFFEYSLGTSYPSVGSIVYVSGDVDSIVSETNKGALELKIEKGIAFYSEKPKRTRFEENQVWTQDFTPWVWLNDSQADWKTEGEDYLKRLKKLLNQPEASLKEKILPEILSNAKTTEEKVFAISDYVKDALTYQGIEFGTRGLMPNDVELTLQNKYGDCKDHSLLLVKLLAAAEIEAHLALVSTGAPVCEELPSMDQFDHMIAYVPALKGSPFIDTTSDVFASGKLAPEQLVFEQSLILEPGNVRLEKIEPSSGITSLIEIERTVTLDPAKDKNLHVTETLLLSGYPSGWYRSFFKNGNPSEYADRFSAMLSSHGAPVVETIKVQNVDDNYADLSLTMTYTLPRHFTQRGQELSVKMPSVFEHYFTRKHHSRERETPFEILLDFKINSTTTLKIPGKFKLSPEVAEERPFSQDGKFVIWKQEIPNADESSITLKTTFKRKKGTFPATDYKEFVETTNSGLDRISEALILVETE